MFGSSRQTEAVLAALRAENSDLRTQLRLEREAAADREKVLLDRILALTNPGALRSVVRATTESPSQDPLQPNPSTPRRIHFPGYLANTRPPLPTRPVADPDASVPPSPDERSAS